MPSRRLLGSFENVKRKVCSHPYFGGETIKDPGQKARVHNGNEFPRSLIFSRRERMAFILGCVIVAFFLVIILYKKKIRFSFSIVLLVLLGISLVSSICLAQNYTQSLVPGINDGIGVSNSLAHLIIGERQGSVPSSGVKSISTA